MTHNSFQRDPNGPLPQSGGENDPLIELARLIGQDDPLDYAPPSRREPRTSEEAAIYNTALRGSLDAPQQQSANEFPDLDALPPAVPVDEPVRERRNPANQNIWAYGMRSGDVPLDDGPQDQWDYEAPSVARVMSGGLGQDRDSKASFHVDGYMPPPPAEGLDDFADETETHKGGFVTVFSVLGLVVLAAGGVFGYQYFLGGGASEPPLIIAEPGPLKMPVAQEGASKVIHDRVDGRPGQSEEKVIAREERPVDVERNITPQPANPVPRVVLPGPTAHGNDVAQSVSSGEPRKVRTEIVRGAGQAPASPTAPVQSTTPSEARITPIAVQPTQSKPLPVKPSASQQQVASKPPTTASAVGPQVAAPLSISPQPSSNQPTQWRAPNLASNPPAAAPVSVPSASAPASAGGGGFVVQISSQRSEGDAQAALRQAQSKHGGVLGGLPTSVSRAEIPGKGTYYRVWFGQFESQNEAAEACSRLKAQGGDCIVTRRK